MIEQILRIATCGLLICLTGCSSLQSFDSDWINQILYTPTSPPVVTPTPTPRPAEATQAATSQPDPSGVEPRILRIWLPPQFNPNMNNPASVLLKQKLTDFEEAHPGLEIEVRIKSESGEADLLNFLSVTSMAAPGAMPDLVALSWHSLEDAAQTGLIHPLEEVSRPLQDVDWFDYARELAEVDGAPYGLPFAGDALIMVYRPDLVWIKTWDDILLSDSRLVFSGADPQAEVALSLYASAGGEFVDAEGDPTFDQSALTRVLELFYRGRGVSLFPDAARNISTDDQVLQEYRARRTEIAVIHYSRYRSPQDGLFQPLMSMGNESHFTFATGWMWALTGQDPDNQQLSIELAEFLMEADFLASWIRESGYLPTIRYEGEDEPAAAVLSVVDAARPVPSLETMQVLGPLMQKALVRVLNGEQPEAVARSVMEELR